INKLAIGDYVVHNLHGIGIYNGLKVIASNDVKKDYIEVLYAKSDKLYIPVEKIDLLSKYSSKDGANPKLNKLSGDEWKKTTARVRNKIKEIAGELITLYAKREHTKGYSFSSDTPLQKEFEDEFSYTPTKDQLVAVAQIKKDMESAQPMDRLLCGDVGYGKTEVAFRAIFKAIMDHKQVLYLCPTTILASQQYKNALERFKNYPINIYLLNRFTSQVEVKKTIGALEKGTADFVIGTHRLLSNDIHPTDLGLLIIDEEQRFGVLHKEKIKEYKDNVDVLTLTATPIPRTLQMSLVGIRSLSLITTPPINRYPIQTYVIEESDALIKDAIYKELSRNGQVFLLYNRVEKINDYADHISKIVPEARIIIAHGQMSKDKIEDCMFKFVNHEADIMICTTIIETGIDIPNVNTLIIKNAENFGLSQLYQIRGRVGRSDKIAYAYLMYQKSKTLTEKALKRLNVIKEFTELGSGFSIATRDLSIRGAGDILGSEQAGFIDTVGMDLYLKILNEEVLRQQDIVPSSPSDEKPLISVTTHISNKYVMDEDLKILIHKKINEIDSYTKLEEVKKELTDRFGIINEDLLLYMHEEWFEKLAKLKHVQKIENTKNSIILYFSLEDSEKIDTEALFVDAFSISTMFRFKARGNQLIIILDTIKLDKHPLYYLIPLLDKLSIKLD
ncbi:MAG: transcription-repair coupling factor, partial [Bacilli bacterium]